MMVLTMMMATASFTCLPCKYGRTHRCLSGTDLDHAWHESLWSQRCQLHSTIRIQTLAKSTIDLNKNTL